MYQVTIFMFKFHHNLLPSVFDRFFRKNITIHDYQTGQSRQLHTPIYKTSVGNLFITKVGVCTWNEVVMNGDEYLNLGALKMKTVIGLMCKY